MELEAALREAAALSHEHEGTAGTAEPLALLFAAPGAPCFRGAKTENAGRREG